MSPFQTIFACVLAYHLRATPSFLTCSPCHLNPPSYFPMIHCRVALCDTASLSAGILKSVANNEANTCNAVCNRSCFLDGLSHLSSVWQEKIIHTSCDLHNPYDESQSAAWQHWSLLWWLTEVFTLTPYHSGCWVTPDRMLTIHLVTSSL